MGALRRWTAIALVASSSLSPAFATVALAEPTAADLESARDLFKEGQALRAKGDLEGALAKFKAANALAGTPITGVELGKTLLQMGKLVEAREMFLSVGRIPTKPTESPQTKKARAEAATLADEVKPRIPALVLTVTGVPAGTTPIVAVDGESVPSDALGAPRRVNPGKHHVTASVEGGKETAIDVEVKEGETKDVPLVVEASPMDATSMKPTDKPGAGAIAAPPKRVSPLVWIGFGVTAVGVVVGGVTGVMAVAKKGNLDSECPNKECPYAVQSDLDTAKRLGLVSTIAFVTAGVGAVVGVVGLVVGGPSTEPAPTTAHVAPWIGAGSLGIRGSF